MTRTEAKENRKRRKIVLAFIMLLFVTIVMGYSAYAWFTANRTVTVESIDVNVSTSQGLQISTDAVNWKSIITNNDITSASWTGVKNQIPIDSMAVPVSTIGEVDTATGFMNMYKGTIQANAVTKDNNLISTKSVESHGKSGDFVVFDLFFQSSEEQKVYLTSNSKVTAKADTTSSGIEYASRVAFIDEGSVAFGKTAAEAQALKDSNLQFIWEPNYDVHNASGISNAQSVYGITTTATGAAKLAYNGVKTEFGADAAVALNDADPSRFSPVTTKETLASGISPSAYLEAFTVKEGVTKIRIYMWIEGQDVDCEDHASGGSLSYNLQFSIDKNA